MLSLDHNISQWNKKNVGKNLKEWIKSINMEWKYDEYSADGYHCKVFLKFKNEISRSQKQQKFGDSG